jgi:predicted ferric reductase
MTDKFSQEPEYESTFTLQSLLYIFLAIAIGMYLAMTFLPTWLPNLTASLMGTSPKAYWYLSRGTAFVAMSLLWASMAFGLTITNKMARMWPGAPTAFAIHEFVSLLGLAFAMFHALVLMGDHFINFTFMQVAIPFASGSFKPLWVGLGQVGFYVWALVTFSFYVRSRIGQKSWRLIHFASFLTYAAALVHGLASGTDTSALWVQWYYWISGSSLLFLLMYRVIASLSVSRPAPRIAG